MGYRRNGTRIASLPRIHRHRYSAAIVLCNHRMAKRRHNIAESFYCLCSPKWLLLSLIHFSHISRLSMAILSAMDRFIYYYHHSLHMMMATVITIYTRIFRFVQNKGMGVEETYLKTMNMACTRLLLLWLRIYININPSNALLSIFSHTDA